MGSQNVRTSISTDLFSNHVNKSRARQARTGVVVALQSRTQMPFIFWFHHSKHVSSRLQCLPSCSKWSLKLQPSHLSRKKWELEAKGRCLTAESAHFKSSWKPHPQSLFISYWSSLTAKEAGKCSLSKATCP